MERITAVVVLEWMSVGEIQYTGKGLGLARSRTVHPCQQEGVPHRLSRHVSFYF